MELASGQNDFVSPSLWKGEVAAALRFVPFHLADPKQSPSSGARLLDKLLADTPGLMTALDPDKLSLVDLLVAACLGDNSKTLAKLGKVDNAAVDNIVAGVAMIVEKLVARGCTFSTRTYNTVKAPSLKGKNKQLQSSQVEKLMVALLKVRRTA